MGFPELPPLEGPGSNANDFMAWLLERPEEDVVLLSTYDGSIESLPGFPQYVRSYGTSSRLVPETWSVRLTGRSAQALFKEILHLASQPRNATKDACVKLCSFVQLCTKSTQEPLRQWAFRQDTAIDLFNYYLDWNEKDQHRSMRLAIDLVSALILQNPDPQVRDSLKADFLSTLVAIISRRSSRPVVKSCIGSLTHFIAKKVLTLDDLAQQYGGLRPELGGEPTLLWRDWVTQLFQWMELHYMCPVVGKLIVTILSGLFTENHATNSGQTNSPRFSIAIMREWLEAALSANPDVFESVKNYVLAPLFKSDRGLSIALLRELNRSEQTRRTGSSKEDVTALLHLAALEVGKKTSVVDDPGPRGLKATPNVVIVDREVLERFLVHNSHEVRSFAMSLLITSSSTTKPYSPMAFELLRRHLRSCHTDPDAKFRNEILAHSKNMVKRIQGAISVLRKDIGRLNMKATKVDANGTPVNTHISQGAKQIANAGETWLRDSLKAHEDFFCWYLDFLRQELVPTASYQRHITSLRSLTNILKLGRESPSSVEQSICQDPQWIRIFLDLVMDPFDDVRETATNLLMLFPVEAIRIRTVYGAAQPEATALEILGEFCTRAADLASRTSRADHSDGAARSLGLLCAWQKTLEERISLLSRALDELEQKIVMAEKDLGSAVMSVPVHGTFAAIRYMWEVLSQYQYSAGELELLAGPQSRMSDLCSRIWNAVSYVLCDDSPEGHLPEELEEIEGLDTKGLLSYSFRAIHESSNLMRTVVGNLRFGTGSGRLLPSSEVFGAVGNLAFTQLSTLRHRGAFSSVSLTFTCCCQNAQHPAVASPTADKTLLEAWYEGTLSCINTQRSTTRRSAGIPSLMTGILASNADSPSFAEVMKTLQEIAATPARASETDGSNLPQVHAFNCIKEVFKSSLLSKHAEAYLAKCLELATGSLRSELWAIRNCALLLLHALIATLFGTTESKASMETGWDGRTLRLSYTKHNTLPPILLSLLQSGQRAMEPSTLAQSSAAESVFPALEIIRRAGPPESHRDELYGYITKYLGSRQWHVREIAARTLCSFLLGDDWLVSVKALLAESRGSANMLHGTLLTVKFFLERTLLEVADRKMLDSLQALELALRSFETAALMCSETVAAYVEVYNILWKAISSEDSVSTQLRLIQDIENLRKDTHFTSTALLNNRVGIMALRKAAASENLVELKTCLLNALDQDTDTACALLEATPNIWSRNQVSQLCVLYLDICQHTKNPEARAAALTNLAELMETSITSGQTHALPSPDALDAFQHSLDATISPALANAVLLASGPITALHALRHHGQPTFFLFEQRLRSWGAALADALRAENTFDTRLAATRALRSFAVAVRSRAGTDAAYIPLLLALYGALVDDDEDVREVAAAATAALVTTTTSDEDDEDENGNAKSPPPPPPLVAVDAADALLSWLGARLGHTNELRAYAACRLAGSAIVAADLGAQDLAAWTPPGHQLAAALRVDESLFAVEEQNLFVDEVREAERWAGMLRALAWERDGDGEEEMVVVVVEGALAALKRWAEDALEGVADLVRRADDGPLGWASGADAFALCCRVLVCGRMLAGLLGEEAQGADIVRLLGQIREAGRASRLHGLLLSVLGDGGDASP